MPVSLGLGLLFGGLAKAGADIAGSVIGAKAANKAANQQVAASQAAQAFNADMYKQAQGYQQPYLDAGQGAVGNLSTLLTPGRRYGVSQVAAPGGVPRPPRPLTNGGNPWNTVMPAGSR